MERRNLGRSRPLTIVKMSDKYLEEETVDGETI
jgi:hypothetical protein